MSKTKSTTTGTKKTQFRRKGIVVLGMHRSGTSATTRVINLLGGDIAANLMPAKEGDNATGFWESQDIYEIHEQMLSEAVGMSWDDFSPFPTEWYETPKAAEFEQRFLEKLTQDFEKSEIFVLKDPRICRMLPFWLRIFEKFDTEPFFAIPIRNPIEVARSLKSRDGFHFAKSYLLWLRHNLEAERDSRGYKRSFFTYEMLLEDWRGTMAKVYTDLGMHLPQMSHYHDAQTEGYLSNRWRHHVISPEDVFGRQEIVGWVKTAYEVLLKAAGDDFEGMTETLDTVLGAFNTADKAYGPLVADAEQRIKQYGEAAVKANALEGECAELRESLIRKDEELHILQHKVDQFTEELKEIDVLNGYLRERDEQINTLTSTLKDKKIDVANLRRDLSQMRNSTSWRVSSPVRLAGKLIGKE